jgi:hypothetical protein
MIFKQLSEQLGSLTSVISSLTDEQYTRKSPHLCEASIGSHTRHIIELVQCACSGYVTGRVDYLNRSRNLALENDRLLALSALQQFGDTLMIPDKRLELAVENSEGPETNLRVVTTYFREIVYNTEHAIHHLALIKVALIEMQLQIVDPHFGMAYSTIKYKNALQLNQLTP